MTHRENERCPFAPDAFPKESTATCCSLRGKIAALNLDLLEEDDLARGMFNDMSADEAIRFAGWLRQTADNLELRWARYDPNRKGGRDRGTIELTREACPFWPIPTFEEAVASIREAACWYEKVGRLGFGVHARS